MFKVICVGYDGSEPSQNAVKVACNMADKYGSSVHIIHSPHPETVAFAMGAVAGYHVATTMPTPEETEKSARVMLDKAKEAAVEAGQSDVTTHVGNGDAAQVLTDYAKSVGSDLIVTGRRGLGNFSALVLGSTSLNVGHKATCAHLTVA